MKDPVADSSADDTEESTAASEMTNSPKEAVTQPDGTPTSNSQAEEGCKCVLVCPVIHCHISSHSSSMFLVFSGRDWSELCLL